jgi:hypothetical protein
LSSEIPPSVIDQYWKWKNNKKTDLKSVCNVDKEYFICKNRTAGVLVAAHSCGVIVNYKEMITAEGLTQVARLVETTNSFQEIKYVCYDNGCKLDSHVNNMDYNYPDSVRNIKFFIDRLHLKNHIQECQKYSCDKDKVMRFINSQVCEQLFYSIGKFKHMTKHMSKNHFNFFYLMVFEEMNKKKLYCILHPKKKKN